VSGAKTTEPQPEEAAMEIHKPKPVRNWREFLSEVGVVVLGICIALAGEQVIEELRWGSQVSAARTVIATEMAYNLEGAIWRMRTLDCVEQRLDTLAKALDDASRSGSLPPIGNIGAPPSHMWRSGAWESVVASQTAAHFPREQLAALGALYKVVQRIDEHAAPEGTAWSDLYAMVGPGRRLDPASEAQLRSALALARWNGRTMATLSMFLVNQARGLGLPFAEFELAQIEDARTQPLKQARKGTVIKPASPTAICAPVGPVPPGYGEGPNRENTPIVSAAAKSLPSFAAGAP
jgi:hypothetical protein